MPAWDPLEDLTPGQREKLTEYARLLVDVSRRVNLIALSTSRDVESRHLRHSLALALRSFPAHATVVDWGTGGGLPSIPLAIRFPDVRFVAVDSVGRKVEAVRLFARRLDLPNVEAWAGRAERWTGAADYAVSRATAPLLNLWAWYERVAIRGSTTPTGAWNRGLVCLKGGDLSTEIEQLQASHADVRVERLPLEGLMNGPGLVGKSVVAAWRGSAGGLND